MDIMSIIEILITIPYTIGRAISFGAVALHALFNMFN